jgi:hypothetical protein
LAASHATILSTAKAEHELSLKAVKEETNVKGGPEDTSDKNDQVNRLKAELDAMKDELTGTKEVSLPD